MPSWKKLVTSGSNAVLNHVTASGNVSGSSSSTGSFGRVQASAIGGNSPLIIDADNLKLNASGTLSGSATSVGSFGQLKTANDFIVDSNGRVGINTTSPDYKLDVAGNIGMNEYLYHNGDSNTYLHFLDDRLILFAGGDNILDYEEDASSTLKLAGGGEADVTIGDSTTFFVGGSQGSYDAKVGIGTSTPGYALDVSGTIRALGGNIFLSGANSIKNVNNNLLLDAAAGNYIALRPNNGTEAMRINSNGLVGIGESGTIYSKLSVATGSTDTAVVKARSTATNGRASYQIGNDADNWYMGIDGGNSDAFFIADAAGSSDRLVITQAGNIGIGHTSPTELLHIKKSTGDVNLIIESVAASTTPTLHIKSPANRTGVIKFHEGGALKTSIFHGTDDALWFYLNSGNDAVLQLNSDKSIRMYGTAKVDSNFGIGASPIATYSSYRSLTLGGLTTLTSDSGTSAGGFFGLAHNAHTDTDNSWEYIATDEATMYQQVHGTHRFFTAGSGTAGNDVSWSERLRIANDGKVGIGETSPAAKLQITGGGVSNSLIIKGSGAECGIQFVDSGGTADGFIKAGDGYIGFLDMDGHWAVRHVSNGKTEFRVNNSVIANITATGISGSSTSTGSFGTVVIPSQKNLQFGDLNTRIRGDGSNNNLTFHTNNTERVRITDDGMGIGGDPVSGTQLTVYGSVSGSATSTGSFGHLVIGSDSTTFKNLSIDQLTTQAAITVDESAGTSNSAVLNLLADRPNDGQDAAEIRMRNNSGISFARIVGVRGSADTYGDLQFRTRNASGLTTRLAIDQDGNVGIGETSPDEALHITSTAASATPVILLENSNANNLAPQLNLYNNSASPADNDYVGQIDFEGNDSGDNRTQYARIIASSQDVTHTLEDGMLQLQVMYNSTLTSGLIVRGMTNGAWVGIGETNPESPLHIKKASAGSITANANSVLTLEDDGTTVLQFLSPSDQQQQIRFGDTSDDGAGILSYNHSTNAMQFATAGPIKMTLDSSGNLGIGTTSPTQKLEVSGNILLPTAGTHKLMFTNSAVQIDRTGGHLLRFEAFAGYKFQVNGSEKMSMDSSGNVGIGTTTPSNKLDIEGDGARLHISSSDFPLVKMGGYASSGGFEDVGYLSLMSAGNETIRLGAHSGISTYFTQNVGIATTSPGSKLDVAGEIRGQKYAFNDDTNTFIDTFAEDQIGFTLGANQAVKWAYVAGAVTQQFMYGASATYPSYTFNSDQDTGMYLATNGAIGFSTGGSERMRINSTGLGIGISNPTAKLHVDGDAIVTGKITAQEFHTEFVSASIQFSSGSTKFGDTNDDLHQFTGSMRIQRGDDVTLKLMRGSQNVAFIGDVGSSNDGGLILYNESGALTTLLRTHSSGLDSYINSTGNFGLGTNGPTQKFDVRGGLNSVHAMFSGQDSRGLLIETQATTNNDDTVVLNAQTSTGEIAFETNSTERMRIDSSGKVGIGLAAPSEKLEVAGGIAFSGTATMTEGNDFGKATIDTDGADRMRFHINGTNNAVYGGYEFRQSKGDHSDERLVMLIDETGKVGIGISAADGKLHVSNGLAGVVTANADADELVIENSGNAGISILTPDTSNGAIFFGDTADNNVGIIDYDHNVNKLSFTVAASKAITINASRNVGIGTESPTGLLSFPAADSDTPKIRFLTTADTDLADAALSTTDDSGGTALLIGSNIFLDSAGAIDRFTNSRSGAGIQFDYTGRVKFFTESGTTVPSEKMRLDENGRLGIGMTPTHNFNLRHDGNVEFRVQSTDDDARLQISSDTDEGQDSVLEFLSGTSTRGSILYDHNTTANSQKMDFKVGDNAVTAMTILGNGHVGIGEALSGHILHINSGDTIVSLTETGGNSGAYLDLGRAKGTVASPSDLNEADLELGRIRFLGQEATAQRAAAFISAFTSGVWTGASYPSYMTFSTTATSATSPSERMRIDKDGNVGIGTTSPTTALDIVSATSGEFAALKLHNTNTNADDNVAIHFRPANLIPAKIVADAPGASDVNLEFHTINAGSAGAVFTMKGDNVFSGSATSTGSFGKLIGDGSGLTGVTATAGAAGNQYNVQFNSNGSATGGSDNFVFNSSNNRVGIGTSSPDEEMHLKGAEPKFRIENSSDSGKYFNMHLATGGGVSKLRFDSETHSNTLMVTNDNRVGIGVGSPAVNLHIEDSQTDTDFTNNSVVGGSSIIISNQQQTDNTFSSLQFIAKEGDGNDQSAAIVVESTSATTYSPKLHIVQRTAANTQSTRLTMDESGDVGIGTSSPVQKLDVRGTVTASAFHANMSTDAGSPEYSFGGDPDTGMYSAGANVLGFSTGGTVRLNLTNSVFTSQVTGGVRLGIGNGSGAAPTYTFNDDSDTGMYRDSANTLAFSTEGVERLRLSNSGNGGSAQFSGPVNIAEYLMHTSDADTYLRFETNKTSLFGGGGGIVVDGGTVGINKASPTDTLHVGGGITMEAANAILAMNVTNTTGACQIRFGDTGDSDIGKIVYGHNTNAMSFNTSDAERLRIDASGNVGIGTTSPVAQGLTIANAGDVNLTLLADSDANATNNWPMVDFRVDNVSGNPEARIYYKQDITSLVLATNNNNAVVVNSSGKVGIGTTSPEKELHVVGDIRATGDVIANRLVVSSSVSHITSSFSSGSTIFGDSADDLHQFTGSVEMFTTDATDDVLSLKSSWSTSGNYIGLAFNDGWIRNNVISNLGNRRFGIAPIGTEILSVTAANRVGIGQTSPDGTLHIQSGHAGSVVAGTSADDLIVENSGDAGISVISPDANSARIQFGSPSDNDIGHIGGFYNSGNEYLFFNVGGSEAMRIDASNNVSINTTATYGNLSVGGTGEIIAGRASSGAGSFSMYESGTTRFVLESLNGSGGIAFKTPSTARMILDDNSRISLSNNDNGTSNTIFGKNAGLSLDAGSNYNVFIGEDVSDATMADAINNVGIGYQALSNVTTTDDNVAIGFQAGTALRTGNKNVIIGSQAGHDMDNSQFNVVIGDQAMANEVNGDRNTAVGYHALYSQDNTGTEITENVALGAYAGYYNVTGTKNTYLGTNAGFGASAQSNSSNVGLGYNALNKITTGTENVSVGKDSMLDNTSGASNTAIGTEALANNTTGGENVAIGKIALYTNSTTGANTAVGYTALRYNVAANNTAVGHASLHQNTSGTENVALGVSTAFANTTGLYNTAVGYQALVSNVDGDSNTAIGRKSLYTFEANSDGVGENTAVGALSAYSLSTGIGNTSIGKNSMTNATTADGNVAVGLQAMGLGVVTGNNNVAVGNGAAYDLTSGYDNVIVGKDAAVNLTSGYENVALGYATLAQSIDTVGAIAIGRYAMGAGDVANNYQIAIGHNAMGELTSGELNLGIGRSALGAATSAHRNLAIGHLALDATTSGDDNIAVGHSALGDLSASGGHKNIAIGNYAGDGMAAVGNHTNNIFIGYDAGGGTWTTTSSNGNVAIGGYALDGALNGANYNVAVGEYALSNVSEADNTVAVGRDAGGSVTTGANNTLIGFEAGKNGSGDITTGQANTIIGSESSAGASDAINRIAIGRTVVAVADNSVTLGNANVTAIYAAQDRGATIYAAGLVEGSSMTLKENIGEIESPLDKLTKLRGVEFDYKSTKERSIGMIAEEVNEVFPELVNKNEDGEVTAMSYSRMTAVLLEAVKELSQEVKDSREEIRELKKLNNYSKPGDKN